MSNPVDSINHIIRSRRSIFPASYTREDIPKEIIQAIVANANYAPTHKLTQPWHFRIFRKRGLESLANELGRLYRESTPPDRFLQAKYEATRDKVLQSSCVIAIVMKTHSEKLPEWEELASVACAVQNIWLTATAYDVGAYWSSPGSIQQLGEFLELAPDEKCIGIFYMGYHQEPPREAQRLPIEEKISWIEE
ncbi:MAG TPA: nitroreductase [Anseongella sp.]|nr:nitroreductase [Anseongella sp.]